MFIYTLFPKTTKSLQPHKDIASLPVRAGWIALMPPPKQAQSKPEVLLAEISASAMRTLRPNDHKTNIKSWLQNSITPSRAMAFLSSYTAHKNIVLPKLQIHPTTGNWVSGTLGDEKTHTTVSINKGHFPLQSQNRLHLNVVSNPLCRGNAFFQGQMNVKNNPSWKEALEAFSPLSCWKQGQIPS